MCVRVCVRVCVCVCVCARVCVCKQGVNEGFPCATVTFRHCVLGKLSSVESDCGFRGSRKLREECF